MRQGPGRKRENTGVAVVSTDPETVTLTDSQCTNIIDLLFSDLNTEIKLPECPMKEASQNVHM